MNTSNFYSKFKDKLKKAISSKPFSARNPNYQAPRDKVKPRGTVSKTPKVSGIGIR